MASPRVFISSTCYDLKHIRESLKYFVKTIGYDPVLSEDGDVFFDPTEHTHDSCLNEVPACQILVLIIGGRYGGKHKNSDKSITCREYETAVENNIPIFTLVDSGTYADHHTFTTNRKVYEDESDKDKVVDYKKITYPNVDNIKIFDFIDDVRKKSYNNAIQPFRNFSEIESYLRKQWAGMMYDFLIKSKNDSEQKITRKLLDDITLAGKKTEELVKKLITSVEKESGTKLIEDVELRSKAEQFIKFAGSFFELFNIKTNISTLVKALNSSKDYVRFISSAFNLKVSVTDLPNEKICVFSIEKGSIGYEIHSDKEIDENFSSYYEALKSLPADDKKEVLSKFL